MERISHHIEKIRTTYYDNREKTLIDLDLLLDYTRVMYADLLEWRADLDADSATPELAPTASEVPAEAAPEKRAPTADIVPNPPIGADNPASETAGHHKAEAPAEKQVPKAPVSPEASALAENKEQPSPADKRSGTADSNAVQEEERTTEAETETNKTVERMKNDPSSISFEPPSDAPASGQPQHAPTRPELPVEEIPVPPVGGASEETKVDEEAQVDTTSEAAHVEADSENNNASTRQETQNTDDPEENRLSTSSDAPKSPAPTPLPDFKKIFEKANTSGQEERSDIRKLIGINDKYLFLNELFNNHKSEYEETLDRLNKMDSATSARQFLEEEIAPKYKWHAEDGTVESFYWLVERHLKR